VWAVSTRDLLRAARRDADRAAAPTPVVVDAQGSAGSATLLLVAAYGVLRDASARVTSTEFWMLVPSDPETAR
jgi:hypothetical protein